MRDDLEGREGWSTVWTTSRWAQSSARGRRTVASSRCLSTVVHRSYPGKASRSWSGITSAIWRPSALNTLWPRTSCCRAACGSIRGRLNRDKSPIRFFRNGAGELRRTIPESSLAQASW